jgi:uncharacterized protein with HEPN domain
MSKGGREVRDYLEDISAAISEAQEFTPDMTYETFAADKRPSMQ